MRYYFDMTDKNGTARDDEGLELSNLKRVQEEAARSLADMARDAVLSPDGQDMHEMAIEVRDDYGPVLQAKLTFEIARVQKLS
jgi:hypothetical protein